MPADAIGSCAGDSRWGRHLDGQRLNSVVRQREAVQSRRRFVAERLAGAEERFIRLAALEQNGEVEADRSNTGERPLKV
jgi:hypothetical protein